MKKSAKKRSSVKSSGGTGIILLICFVIASISVAVALRQIVLERQHFQSLITKPSPAPNRSFVGIYTTQTPNFSATLDLNLDRSVTLSKDFANNKLDSKESGSWSGDTNGTIIVSIGTTTTYAFTGLDNSLTLLNPDAKVWGSTKIIFTKN